MHTGDEYFDSNEFKNILTDYEESLRRGEPIFMDTEDLIDIADYYNFCGNRDKATAAVDTALELYPGATLPLVFKAREALANEDIKTAQKYANEITDKDDYDYQNLVAEIMVAQDMIEDAEKFLKNIYKNIDDNECEDFIYDVSNMYLEYGVYDKAYEWITECGEVEDPEHLDIRGRALVGLGRYEEGILIFDKLIDQDPRSSRHWAAMANAQFLNEDYNDAITSCEYALALDPQDLGSLLVKANSLSKIGNFETALEYFLRYNAVAPKDGYSEMNVGTTMLHLSRFDEAITHLHKAARQTESAGTGYEQQIYEALAFAYSSMGVVGKAVEYMEKVLIQENDIEGIAEKLIINGHILLTSGQTQQAEAMFRDAIIKSGNSPEIILRVIVSLMDNKYTDIAYNMFKIYFSVMDDVTEGYSYMALCCWELQKNKEFLQYFKKALTYNPAEVNTVLSHIIPQGMTPFEFFHEINKHIN